MYINKEWQIGAKEKAAEVREKIEEKNDWKVKVVINEESNSGIAFKAENPRFILSKAEVDFKSGKLFDAWWKTNYVENKDIEEREKELMQGSDEDKKLAKIMYADRTWMEEEKNKWRNSDQSKREK
ncbi:MAG: hypothetical protein P1P85_02335 [Patescibacteria group bacterium]|nr:hypothetical protein [Patescibacteria group bacterium]